MPFFTSNQFKMKNLFINLIVFSFLVGFIACKGPSGEDASISKEGVASPQIGLAHQVNLSESMVLWEGSKPTGTHTGTVSIKNGTVYVKDGQVSAGEFTLDMPSINVTDLEGKGKEKLEGHLKGSNDKQVDDFFNVSKYPEATFEITKATNLQGDPNANTMIYGNLTMKGITKQVGFKANININNQGVSVTTPPFKINRTDWNINFRSPSLFENLQDKAISDEIGLSIKLSAPAPMS
jgi:polyisoprenoid-binding protein YceI